MNITQYYDTHDETIRRRRPVVNRLFFRSTVGTPKARPRTVFKNVPRANGTQSTLMINRRDVHCDIVRTYGKMYRYRWRV